MHHYMTVLKVLLDLHVCPSYTKWFFMCIVLLFPLEIIEERISAGHFRVELDEIRAAFMFSTITATRGRKRTGNFAKMYTQTHTRTPVSLHADLLNVLSLKCEL